MAIIAPLSSHKKGNIKIYIIACIALAIWCAYDGYYNEKWIKEHTDKDGQAEAYLVFNRKAPMYLGGAVILFGAYLFTIRDRRVSAEETELVIDNKERISYDSIEKVDKTSFKSKGYFIITHKDGSGREISRKISDRTYDNLEAVLNEVVSKIS